MNPDGQPAGSSNRSSSVRQSLQRDEEGKFISSRKPQVSSRHTIGETDVASPEPQKISEQKQESYSKQKQKQGEIPEQKQEKKQKKKQKKEQKKI